MEAFKANLARSSAAKLRLQNVGAKLMLGVLARAFEHWSGLCQDASNHRVRKREFVVKWMEMHLSKAFNTWATVTRTVIDARQAKLRVVSQVLQGLSLAGCFRSWAYASEMQLAVFMWLLISYDL